MPRITNFETFPAFGAAMAHGPALVPTFPFAKPSLTQHAVIRYLKRLLAKQKAAQRARRNARELAALSDGALRDIGLNRANIVSAATEAGVLAHRVDTNE